jgi:hypothetical protein
VVGLLVLAAVAAHGKPLGAGGRGAGPGPRYFDYLFTSVVLVFALLLALALFVLVTERDQLGAMAPHRKGLLGLLLFVVTAFVVAWALTHLHLQVQPKRIKPPTSSQTTPTLPTRGAHAPTRRGANLRWDEVAIVLAALAAVGGATAVARYRRRVRPLRLGRRELVSLAFDESLDDLRAEPDLRRAIVAAYARMERALAAAGLPRRPAEAPLEYLQRALRELETSADAVRRLTELFEWARFSQHEPEPWMRDEAVDALVVVRDELREPEKAVA